jgi:hypothetical protein
MRNFAPQSAIAAAIGSRNSTHPIRSRSIFANSGPTPRPSAKLRSRPGSFCAHGQHSKCPRHLAVPPQAGQVRLGTAIESSAGEIFTPPFYPAPLC